MTLIKRIGEILAGSAEKPSFDKHEIDFGAIALELAEARFFGTFEGDGGEAFLEALFKEYRGEGGKPVAREMRAWLLERLPQVFQYVDKPPGWVLAPEWPFLDSKPMVFVAQLAVPETEKAGSLVLAGEDLFVFGGRRELPELGGWEMVYAVVAQTKKLAGIASGGIKPTKRKPPSGRSTSTRPLRTKGTEKRGRSA